MSKKCYKCELDKLLSEFYKDTGTHSGYKGPCKECCRTYNKTDARKAAVKKYKQSDKGKKCNKTYKQSEKGRLAQQRERSQYSYPIRSRRNTLAKCYGITIEIYDQMLADQNGVCAICLEAEKIKAGDKVRRLAVDHYDDASGKPIVRGLLCYECNTSLGKFKDSLEVVGRAYSYLLERGN